MSILTLCTFILASLTTAQASTQAYSSAYGSIPSIIEIWEPDVTVTEHYTATVHKTCQSCQTGSAAGAFYDVDLSTSTSSTTPLWAKSSSPTVTTILAPVPHWRQDATSPDVLIPEHEVRLYYAPSGNGNSQTPHQFQWINSTLSAPAVPLDQSSLINYSWSASKNTLSVSFTSEEAFDTARSNWATSHFLVAFTEGCGDYDKGDNCYIKIDALSFSSDTYSCQVTGQAYTLKQCLVSMEASWGKYSPSDDSNQATYNGNFAAAAANLWNSVYSKHVSSSYSAQSNGWAYTPAGAAASANSNGLGSSNWANWAYGAGTVTSSATISTGTGAIATPSYGSAQDSEGYSSVVASGANNPVTSIVSSSGAASTDANGSSGSPPSDSSLNGGPGSSTTASPENTITTTGPAQTVAPTVSGGGFYQNGTASYPAGNDTSSGMPYSGTDSGKTTLATITTPPVTTTTTGALSSVVSSLSSIFSSLAASNGTGLANGTVPNESTLSSGSGISNTTTAMDNSASTSTVPSDGTSTNSNTTYGAGGSYNSNSTSNTNSTNIAPTSSLNGTSAGNLTTSYNNTTLSNSTIPVNATTYANGTTTFPNSNCTKGTDPIFGLPTTCIGPAFDLDLDSIDGFLTLDKTEFAAIVTLFPGLITTSVLANTKRGAELIKRCEWYDVVCDLEEAVDAVTSVAGDIVSSVSSIASSIVSVASTDIASATSAIEAAATELADSIVSAAEAAGQEISEGAAAIIAELENGLSDLLNFHKSFSMPVEIKPGDDSLQESPWGEQPLLGSYGKGGDDDEEEEEDDKSEEKSGDKSDSSSEKSGSGVESKTDASFKLSAFCVDCAVTGTVVLEGQLSVDLTGIKTAMVGASADLDLALAIGLQAEGEVTQTFSLTLFQEGIPELCSGSALCIGPYIKLAAEIEAKAEITGYILAGGNWAISGATAQLFMYGGTSNANNWTPAFTPRYNVGGEIKLSTTFSLPLSVGCGVTLLDGEISENFELGIKPSIEASATAAVNITSDGTESGTTIDTTTNDGECDGIALSLDWNLELEYNILNLLEGDLWELGEQNIAESCIPWSDIFTPAANTSVNDTASVGFGSGSGNLTSAFSDISLIDVSDQTPLLICGNGNVYKTSSGYAATDSSCTTSWLAYSGLSTNVTTAVSNTSSVVADGSHRLPVIFPDVISKTGVSRFRLVASSAIPAKAEYVAFDFVAGTGWLAVDRKGQKYQAVQCSNINATTAGIGAGMNEVFMVAVSATTAGVGALSAEQLVYSVSNGYVSGCAAVSLSLSTVVNAFDPAVAAAVVDAANAVASAVGSVVSGISDAAAVVESVVGSG